MPAHRPRETQNAIASILEGRGLTLVEASERGPDRGVDILAGSGPMGLDAPRVVVQVKTGQAGVDEYRALRGVVENLPADHGLLVAWGGFKGTVRQEACPTFFAVRMWDADGLIDELFAVYEQMSPRGAV
jgi:restriction system protein